MRCILAVDSGGSKCEAALVRDDGAVLGWGICRQPGLSGRSREAIAQATGGALAAAREPIRELHVACLDWEVPNRISRPDNSSAVEFHRLGEYEGALNLIGCDHGIVALAGTGALIHVVAPDGRSVLLDGVGPMLGDWGSGYQIGQMAMRAAMRSSWHPRHRTGLEAAVLAAFAVTEPRELIPLSLENPDRCVVAALASEVDRLARAGDAVARNILEEAAGALAETLRDAVESLELTEEPMPLVGVGSVAKRSHVYWETFCELAAEIAPRLTPVLEPMPSAAGMALALLRQLPGVDERSARENLFVSTGEMIERMEGRTQ